MRSVCATKGTLRRCGKALATSSKFQTVSFTPLAVDCLLSSTPNLTRRHPSQTLFSLSHQGKRWTSLITCAPRLWGWNCHWTAQQRRSACGNPPQLPGWLCLEVHFLWQVSLKSHDNVQETQTWLQLLSENAPSVNKWHTHDQQLASLSSSLWFLQDAERPEDVCCRRDLSVGLHLPQAAGPWSRGRHNQVPTAKAFHCSRPARPQSLPGQSLLLVAIWCGYFDVNDSEGNMYEGHIRVRT